MNPLGRIISSPFSSIRLKYRWVPQVFFPAFFLMKNSEWVRLSSSLRNCLRVGVIPDRGIRMELLSRIGAYLRNWVEKGYVIFQDRQGPVYFYVDGK